MEQTNLITKQFFVLGFGGRNNTLKENYFVIRFLRSIIPQSPISPRIHACCQTRLVSPRRIRIPYSREKYSLFDHR